MAGGTSLLLGAGTILNVDQVKEAVDAGAKNQVRSVKPDRSTSFASKHELSSLRSPLECWNAGIVES